MTQENKEFLDFAGLVCFLTVVAVVILFVLPGVN
jgi:hypothetical protein